MGLIHKPVEQGRGLVRALLLFWALATPVLAATPEDIRDEIFVTLQRATATVAGQALQQAALRQMADNEELAALLRQRQDLSDRREDNRTALAVAVGQSGAASEARVRAIQTQLETIQVEAATLDLEIEAAFPSFKELTDPRPMTRKEVQQALHPDEALIVTLTSDFDVFVWAISKTRADWIAVSLPLEDLTARVKLLRQMLDVTSANRSAAALEDDDAGITMSVRPFDRVLAHQLYSDLLAPLEPVFGDARHLITVVDGPLTSLPLSVLVATAPQGEDTDAAALRDTDWLISRFALTTLPNVSSLRALRQTAHAKGADDRQPFVGFGDPQFRYREDPGTATGVQEDDAGYATRGVFEAVSDVARLAPLPNTARELRRLARITGVDESALHLGVAATETAIKSTDLSHARILAFATHGLLTGELSGLSEPALVFTPPEQPGPQDDALLMASEAAALNLSADLIILSACNTAGSDGTPGAEGLSGLARAFIYAGARSILVSHWPVDDYATSILTTGMVAQMQDGTDRAEALRQSILHLMREDADPAHAHPRFWAPFVLVGEG